MLFYKCPKCNGKYVAATGISCPYCNIESNAGTDLYGNFHRKQPEIAAQNETHLASTSGIHMVPNNKPSDISITRENRERNYQDTDKTVQELVAKPQRSQEISKNTDKNSYLIQEKSEVTNFVPSGNSQPVHLRKTFLHNESPWNISQFQGPQKERAPVDKGFLNDDWQWNWSDSICSSTHSKQTHFSPIVEDSRGLKTLGTSKNPSYQYSTDMVSSDPSHNQRRSASNSISKNESNQNKIVESGILRNALLGSTPVTTESRVPKSLVASRVRTKKAAPVQFTTKDNPSRPKDGYTNPGCNQHSVPNMAAIQNGQDYMHYIIEMEIRGNSSVSNFKGSEGSREAGPSTRDPCDNISRSGQSQGHQFSTSEEDSRWFNMLKTFRNPSVSGAREARPSTRDPCDNISRSVQSQGHQFSTSVEDSRCFNTLDTSRNPSVSGSREAGPSTRDPCDNISRSVQSQGHQFSPSVGDSRYLNTLDTSRNPSDSGAREARPTRDLRDNISRSVQSQGHQFSPSVEDSRCFNALDTSRNPPVSGAREARPSTRDPCDNISRSVQSQGHQFSPSVEDSRCLNTLDTSRNPSDPYGMAVNSFDPAHYWHNSASNYIFHNETYPDYTKYKPEIRGKFAGDLSTDSRKDIHYDETLEMNVPSKMRFPNRAVAGIDEQNMESHYGFSQIEDSRCFNMSDTSRNHSYTYATAVNSSNTAQHWNNSASNYVFSNETYPDGTKYKPEICGKFEDLSNDSKQDIHYDETLELNASRPHGISKQL